MAYIHNYYVACDCSKGEEEKEKKEGEGEGEKGEGDFVPAAANLYSSGCTNFVTLIVSCIYVLAASRWLLLLLAAWKPHKSG